MAENIMHLIKRGKGTRVSFSAQHNVLEMPNLIEIQKSSYDWFIKEGLKEIFSDISPIENFDKSLSLEFVDYKIEYNNIK